MPSLYRISTVFLLILLSHEWIIQTSCFTLVMMGARRGKGMLRKGLEDSPKTTKSSSVSSLNQGRGQEITGVTLPAEGKDLLSQKK